MVSKLALLFLSVELGAEPLPEDLTHTIRSLRRAPNGLRIAHYSLPLADLWNMKKRERKWRTVIQRKSQSRMRTRLV